jgi:CheY-like chemotaxis protein
MAPGRLHILVVDDVSDAADSTAELLSLWGYDARACYCGATALESAGIRRPDVVLLDLAMPRMNGFQFAGFFRELPLCEAVPIVAVSGFSGAVFLARAREAKIQHYLVKPADPDQLRELLAWEVIPVCAPVSSDHTDFGVYPVSRRPARSDAVMQ